MLDGAGREIREQRKRHGISIDPVAEAEEEINQRRVPVMLMSCASQKSWPKRTLVVLAVHAASECSSERILVQPLRKSVD